MVGRRLAVVVVMDEVEAWAYAHHCRRREADDLVPVSPEEFYRQMIRLARPAMEELVGADGQEDNPFIAREDAEQRQLPLEA